MVIKELKNEVGKLLNTRDTQLLITEILDISVTSYLLSNDLEIEDEKAQKILKKAIQIKEGAPLQYVTGYTEFMSLKFKVSPSVLIPRPDTETLVETAISEIGDKTQAVLDIGSGSGCVAISIAHYCKNSSVSSIDISKKALEVAKENSTLNNTKVNFMLCDIMNDVPTGKYDVIVSNPPYIPTADIETLDTNVRCFEPKTALDGGCDGLDFYKRIISLAPSLLKKNGTIIFEVGHDQAECVAALLDVEFKDIECIKDLCGINRVVMAYLK